jgi:hypothetical protein
VPLSRSGFFVLFLIYTSIVELNAHLGEGDLVRIFFMWHSPGMQQMGPVADLSVPPVRPANGALITAMTARAFWIAPRKFVCSARLIGWLIALT